jgi:hypothetical protein
MTYALNPKALHSPTPEKNYLSVSQRLLHILILHHKARPIPCSCDYGSV